MKKTYPDVPVKDPAAEELSNIEIVEFISGSFKKSVIVLNKIQRAGLLSNIARMSSSVKNFHSNLLQNNLFNKQKKENIFIKEFKELYDEQHLYSDNKFTDLLMDLLSKHDLINTIFPNLRLLKDIWYKFHEIFEDRHLIPSKDLLLLNLPQNFLDEYADITKKNKDLTVQNKKFLGLIDKYNLYDIFNIDKGMLYFKINIM
jgi:hypothetical protein